ncbi:MAG: hypothetical protein ABIE47_06610 [Pseudomonadota bacterium]
MKGLSLSEPMVKAWLAGNKRVTRRLMNPQPILGLVIEQIDRETYGFFIPGYSIPCDTIKPRYLPGEIVYIKETWRETWCSGSPAKGYEVGIEYRATWTGSHDPQGRTVKVPEMHYGYKITKKGTGAWKSPRFMPEWAARSHALIVSVRPERVQEITEGEAIREGVKADPVMINGFPPVRYFRRDSFRRLWMNLHPGSWERNDWVWRIELEHE